VVERLDKWLGKGKGEHVKKRCSLTIGFLFYKLWNLLHSVGQFIVMNRLLAPHYSMWGFDIIRDLANGQHWQESGVFPRVTLCDFQIRHFGNQVNRHTIQCVLKINMFNEKIFLMVWFWLVLLSIINAINFLRTFYASVIQKSKLNFVMNQIYFGDPDIPTLKVKEVEQFMREQFHADFLTLLSLINTNTGDDASSYIIAGYWKKWTASQAAKKAGLKRKPQKV